MATGLENITQAIIESYEQVGGINHIEDCNLPSRLSIIKIIKDLETVILPGFREEAPLEKDNLAFSINERVARAVRHLSTEIHKSLNFRERSKILENTDKKTVADQKELQSDSVQKKLRDQAEEMAWMLMKYMPEIRSIVMEDVEAALKGDPAAKSQEEVILSYPGVEAIMIHRVANRLWYMGIPLIPRMISEYIHGKTGIDIHPGATIAPGFFIDHGTGVVIGETTKIGKNVKIYQGVTLGALSVRKTEANMKRHPTLEDGVTIYAGATILGGETIIGQNSTIGGNVWLTNSVPPNSKIYTQPSSYIMKAGKEEIQDFQI